MMRAFRGFVVGAGVLVLCLVLTTPAQASNRENSWELGLLVPYYHFDDPLGGRISLNDAPGLALRFGYNITENHEVEATFIAVPTDFDVGSSTRDVDFAFSQVGYVYNWSPSQKNVPFATAGLGSVNTDVSGTGDWTDSYLFGGGGLRHFFTDNFGLRFEGAIQIVDDEDDTLTHFYAGVGVTWVLGG